MKDEFHISLKSPTLSLDMPSIAPVYCVTFIRQRFRKSRNHKIKINDPH